MLNLDKDKMKEINSCHTQEPNARLKIVSGTTILLFSLVTLQALGVTTSLSG